MLNFEPLGIVASLPTEAVEQLPTLTVTGGSQSVSTLFVAHANRQLTERSRRGNRDVDVDWADSLNLLSKYQSVDDAWQIR